jgi:hypothetical protein
MYCASTTFLTTLTLEAAIHHLDMIVQRDPTDPTAHSHRLCAGLPLHGTAHPETRRALLE